MIALVWFWHGSLIISPHGSKGMVWLAQRARNNTRALQHKLSLACPLEQQIMHVHGSMVWF
jgi:hypothetical protein